jgi:hypothetical protein
MLAKGDPCMGRTGLEEPVLESALLAKDSRARPD